MIEIKNLSWKPEKISPYILKNINCTFEDGNFYGIIGPNGSGKTTLIRHIMDFLTNEEGCITIDNRKLKKYSRKELARKMAFVPQHVKMESSFCVRDVVMMGRNPYQKRFETESLRDMEIVEIAMERTDCCSYKDKEMVCLSGGESQRVLIARAIAQETPWLIMDEPTSNLDVKHQVELMEGLKRLVDKKTIITVLHDLNLAALYCTHVIMMKTGKICYAGTVDEVLTEENLRDIYDISFEILKNKEGRNIFVPMMNG